MKILFLTYHFPTPDEPGAFRPWQNARLLKELGHEVIVITAGTHYMTAEVTQPKRSLWSLEEIRGIRVIKTFSPPGYRKTLKKRIWNYLCYALFALFAGLKVEKPDIVMIATDPLFIIPIGYLISKIKRAKSVLEERDLYPDTAVALGYLKSKFLIKCLERWQAFFRTKAECIIAATPGIKRILVDKGVNAAKMFVLPNVNIYYDEVKKGFNSQEDIRKEYGWASKFVVLYAGGLGQANEIVTILRAAKIIQDKNNNIKFVFLGEGEKKEQYINFCREYKLNNCEFLPSQPRRKIPMFLRHADICVHSLKRDDFWKCALSSKIFDYLIASKPLVFAGKGDIAVLIKDAQAGLAVEPENPEALAEAILELYRSPEMRERMGNNGRKYVLKHYSKETFLRQFQEVLKRTIKSL